MTRNVLMKTAIVTYVLRIGKKNLIRIIPTQLLTKNNQQQYMLRLSKDYK